MKIDMIVEKTKSGYSAYAEKYPVYTVGKSLEELKGNILEALNLHFEKQGKTVSEHDLKVSLDLPQFFEFYEVINAKALSERIGMNQSLLAQYIKGIKKPSPKQTQRILKGIQQVGKELAAIQFLND
ncbi:MAG: type II toxin-antitoxin system HicB family antitoxin [Bacteroidota bacterium]|nr:type II toxin-antitoxin system HicB family antitoxin [Bacteroidota bacterium]